MTHGKTSQDRIDLTSSEIIFTGPTGNDHKIRTYDGGDNWSVTAYVPTILHFPTLNDALTHCLSADRAPESSE